MRHLAARNPRSSEAIVLVPMRGKYDCLTCVTAMLLGIKYEEVEMAFGGNIDPSKDRVEESQRLYNAFELLIQRNNRGVLHVQDVPPIVEGRRYWVGVRIDDPTNPLSQSMTHSIVIDEAGTVFDPNPEYGEFKSLKDWRTAMTLPHELSFASEMFEFSL
jgi:hypothetical protein